MLLKKSVAESPLRTRGPTRLVLWSTVVGLSWMLVGWIYFWAGLRLGLSQLGISRLPPWAETAARVLLLPWDLPGQYGLVTRASIIPFDATSWAAWYNPIISFLAGTTLVWCVSALWTSLHSRRWMVLVLIGVLAIPHFYGVYNRTAFLQRLLPPTAMACSRDFSGKGVLRYDDIDPSARSVITEDEFHGWNTWQDVALSFGRIPKLEASLQVFALDGKRCGSSYTGTTVLISYNPRTLQLYRVETQPGALGWP